MAVKHTVLEYIADKTERHAAVETAIKTLTGCANASVTYNQRGKPEVVGTPNPCFMSVTTTGSIILCVISDMPVGVDGEHLARFGPDNKTDYTALSDRFFSEDEAEFVREGDGDPLRFVRVWVRKEAYVKLTGKGLSDFANFSVTDGEHFYPKINGVSIRKYTVNFPGSADYLFAIAEM